jgi:hypothetical protein
MSLNLCDRTSISNITILDEKDVKAFEFCRLTHKMSNLAKRIQRKRMNPKLKDPNLGTCSLNSIS